MKCLKKMKRELKIKMTSTNKCKCVLLVKDLLNIYWFPRW